MAFEVKIFQQPDKNLKEIWSSLQANADFYVFQSYTWFENWSDIYLKKNKKFNLRVAVIEYNKKVICILPFQIESRFKLNILRWAGDEQLDYCCPILDKNFKFNKSNFKEILEKTFSGLKKIDILQLRRQPKTINHVPNPFVFYLPNYFDSKNHFISLPDKWKKYENEVLKKKFNYHNKRSKNALKKIGKLRFKIFKNKEENNRILNYLFEQKNTRLSSKKAKILFGKKEYDFYNKLFTQEEKEFQIHLSSLELNNKILAMHLGAIHNKRFYYLIPSMAQELEKYSPGRLLTTLLIKWSISKKLEFFDLALGDEPYKEIWGNNFSEYFNHISSKSFAGLMFVFFFKLKYLLKHYDKNKKFIKVLKKFKI